MKLKKIRTELGLTQEKLGKTMGMLKHHISRIETGERELTKQQIAHLKSIQTLAEHKLL